MPPKTKPGPKPGVKRKVSKGKDFLLYAPGENPHDLKLVTAAKGINGNAAILNAVKSGDAPADTPLVAISKTTVSNQVSAAPKQRDPVFEVKKHSAKRPYTRRAKPGPKPAAGKPATPAKKTAAKKTAAKKTTARKKPGPKPGAKRATKKPAPPAPITGANPFAD